MRPRNAKRNTPEVDRLIGLCLALYASGSRVEDRFWEERIDAMIDAALNGGRQTMLDAALDELQRNHPLVYGTLADMTETRSESFRASRGEEGEWDTLLVAVPILAWTRYEIPSGPIGDERRQSLLTQLHAHVVASDARLALAPFLYSIDQLPRHHVETFQLAQKLAQAALQGRQPKLAGDRGEATAPILADPRFLIAAVAAPVGKPLFRWQEGDGDVRTARRRTLDNWVAQGGNALITLFPGCEIECLLPDAFHAACREADERIRPHTVRTAVTHLTETLGVDASTLRAVIGGFGEQRIDEYRIAFTRRGSNDVLYGVVWPLYGRESGEVAEEDGGEARSPLDEIGVLLRDMGVNDIRRHAGRHEPEFCDDCGTPLYLDPNAEIVHPEMPDDAVSTPSHFH
ncbi:DUF2863 family protein [Chitinasiproducens palmae]|uniref:DUF2863 domain-containing protein n=1 Tax=Chitinasiproducens palmae TaxID=1770053 RepID=A0A1H2PMJ8_9BURK|nr:DUF2863 family protein [Chitinasiproducens palmae]SDV47692.1 Protein of unknown function [Chitinasiproducens palmae]